MDNNASPTKSIIKYKTFLSLPNKKKSTKRFPMKLEQSSQH